MHRLYVYFLMMIDIYFVHSGKVGWIQFWEKVEFHIHVVTLFK